MCGSILFLEILQFPNQMRFYPNSGRSNFAVFLCRINLGLCTKNFKQVHHFDIRQQAAQHTAEMTTLFPMAKTPSKKRNAALRTGPPNTCQFPVPPHSAAGKPSKMS